MDCRPDGSLEELCPICGDRVSGYHYGLLTCESCKGFFKRTVQNNKKYTCGESQQCTIDRTQRKRCPFCRFQKCLHVGMRLEAVRADRMRGGRNKFGPMYKRDRALKQQWKALIQAGRFRLESSHLPTSSTQQRNFTFTHSLQQATVLPWLTPTLEQPSSLSALPPSNTTQHPVTSASRPYSGPRLLQLVLEFLRCDPDELQLQTKMAARLQQEPTNFPEHSNFSQVFVIADGMLCSTVEWARTSIFFKQLNVSDQMKLLHHCWSELLLLDVVSRQVLYGREGHLLLVTGQEVELSKLVSNAGSTMANLILMGQQLLEKFLILKVDRQEFACIKFLILFNTDVKELVDRGFIESVQEQVEAALLEYTLSMWSQSLDRFTGLLQCLSQLRALSGLAEDHLYRTHHRTEASCNSLLTEMLHARRKWT